ncbi:BPI fold-containing family C protein [Ornithorhynchus anatinus]|uniref:BPI fold-containing family C protein n=1 Tax=Ornithorhynchus anatinus TaxID=9258 RepID=UPI00022407CF|nr:BPI fold-containing family C protein [Ornithorhynchus anatinus]
METRQILTVWGFFLLWNLLTASSITSLNQPGIKVRITQKALDYGVQAGMGILEKLIKKKRIPDFKGSETLDFLKVEYIDYNFSNIRFSAFSFPNTSLILVPGTGIKALTNHGSANISTDWEIKSPLFKDEGGASLFLSEVFFTGIINLSRSAMGHPTMKLEDCYVHISHAHIAFSGELSPLYNSFSEPMEKPILKNLNEKLCPIIKDEMERINAELRTLDVLTRIDENTLLDYSLINSPEIQESAIDMDLKGTFYLMENFTDPPFRPAPFTLPDLNDFMVYIGISEYFFRSASFAYFTAGVFNITLTTKEISKHFPQNSKNFGRVISQIAEIYLNTEPFIAMVVVTSPPAVNLQPGNFTVEIPGSIKMFTQPENSTAETILSMNFVASTSVDLVILGQKLICSLSLNRFRLSVPQSNRSSIEMLRFENILSSVLHFGLIPLANAKLQKGFPLPNLDQITLVNSDIEVHQGFLLVSTDVHYNPSLRKQYTRVARKERALRLDLED